jgi:hypothetical protein
LASVLQNRPDDCEILVAHVQDYSDPYGLQNEVCFLSVPHARSQVELLNAGFEAARSGIIHVLQCGLEVDDAWTDQAMEQLSDAALASVIPVIVDRSGNSRIVSAGIGYSRLGRRFAVGAGRQLKTHNLADASAVGPTLQGGFYRRSWWRLVRWDGSLGDAFADVQHALTLKALGAQTAIAKECVIRSEKPSSIAPDEPLDFTTARAAERLYWRYAGEEVSRGTLAMRVALSFVEALAALPSPRAVTGLLGRMAGWWSRPRGAEFQTRLAELRAKLQAEQAEAEAVATLAFVSRPARSPATSPVAKRRAA